MPIQYELLRETYAIIGGIPARAFNLEKVIKKKGKSLECGTVACAIGWLSMHPKFQAMGLAPEYDADGGSVMLNGSVTRYDIAIAQIFGVSEDMAYQLFCPKGYGEIGSDKQVFLDRIKTYLGARGQLTAQLEAEAA